MKLGIVVVYMVKPENTELFDLHLRKIRTTTRVPYTIYAGVRQLPPPLLERLESEPQLEIVPLPEIDLRGDGEHSLYLEHLIARAMSDDLTHVVTMHVDSFPIRPDWAETIAAQLTGDTVLATLSIDRFLVYNTACLFFRRDFWEECRPGMLLTESDRSSPEYERFCREYEHGPRDSGSGYIFRAYSRGKAFLVLERSNADRSGGGGSGNVHGDLVFHLGGAHRFVTLSEEEQTAASQKLFASLIAIRSRIKKWVPRPIRRRAKRPLSSLFASLDRRSCDHIRRELLNDPETYLKKARFGSGSE